MALAAVLVTGCGGRDSAREEPAPAGAKVFASARCGSCHTLSAARANGRVGPDLDAVKPAYDAVVRQVSNGGGGMPRFAGRLSARQIREVAAFVSGATATAPTRGAIAFSPDSTTLSGCREPLCRRQAFGNIAYRDGPRVGLRTLAARMRTDAAIRADCHQIAHEIGHAAYVRYQGDAARALSEGSMVCWSGYYHGVIERAFGGAARSAVAAKARTLCRGPAVSRSRFVLYQCVHGLGHGLMIYSADDLPFALAVCDRLATSWQRSSCTGGVFMQNLMPMAGVRTRWLKSDDLLYPCDRVARRHKRYCYLMSTSRILQAVRFDWRRTARWCRRAEHDWVAVCFESFGRDASGQAQGDPRRIVRLCRMARDMEGHCVYGAARDLTANDAGARRAAAMCLLAPTTTRATCFAGIGTIVGTLRPDARNRRATCASFAPRRYRADCVRGAGA
jgi:cytochrome c553